LNYLACVETFAVLNRPMSVNIEHNSFILGEVCEKSNY